MADTTAAAVPTASEATKQLVILKDPMKLNVLIETIKDGLNEIVHRIILTMPQIILILVFFFVLNHAIRITLARLEKHFLESLKKKKDYVKESEKRITTIFGILKKSIFVGLWILAVLVLLKACGIEIGPILAAAGVLGLAIGLGAQNIVRDIFTGIILLVENHIRVGDVVTINGKSGLVESINLRTIVLRDANGTIHVIPNGAVSELSNQTIDWSATVINVAVAYDADIDMVMALMRKVGTDLKLDPIFSEKIIEDIEIFGVTDFTETSVTVRARIKTKPSDQWTVEREYRIRLKKAFDEQRVGLPPSQRTLTLSPNAEAAFFSTREQRLAEQLAVSTPQAAVPKEKVQLASSPDLPQITSHVETAPPRDASSVTHGTGGSARGSSDG